MKKTVTVPGDLYDKVAEVAADQHVSVDEFVAGAVADRLAGREFIASRGRLFNRDEFERALQTVPDVDPEEHDRL